MTDRPKKQLPETFTINDVPWTLMEPGVMVLRNHIGEITAPDGTVFEVSGSINGLAVYLETPFQHPKEPRDRAWYMLDASATIRQLASAIMDCPDD